jgi:hypothetical protein
MSVQADRLPYFALVGAIPTLVIRLRGQPLHPLEGEAGEQYARGESAAAVGRPPIRR